MSVNNSTAMTGALFIHKGTMQRHINAVHLKIKPYECEQCQKSFILKDHLKRHINAIHLEIKPYECDQCKKSFSRKDKMYNHVKSVHKSP